MNKGTYETQINRAWDIIKMLGLDGSRILHPAFPLNAAADFRKLSYIQTWETCYSKRYYNFELLDHSLIHFRVESFDPLNISYAYYECPYAPTVSFDEFLADLGELAEDEDESVLREEYGNYVSQSVKDMCTPIRYDYCSQDYKEGRHPASHLHFGYKSHVRVGTKKILRPLSFIFFILRQSYPDAWQKLTSLPDAEEWSREIRENLNSVDGQYWNQIDNWEMALL